MTGSQLQLPSHLSWDDSLCWDACTPSMNTCKIRMNLQLFCFFQFFIDLCFLSFPPLQALKRKTGKNWFHSVLILCGCVRFSCVFLMTWCHLHGPRSGFSPPFCVSTSSHSAELYIEKSSTIAVPQRTPAVNITLFRCDHMRSKDQHLVLWINVLPGGELLSQTQRTQS